MEFESQLFDLKIMKRLGSHRQRICHILKVYAGRGFTLGHLSEPKILNRTLPTLRKYCRLCGVQFTDYLPRKLRKKGTKK